MEDQEKADIIENVMKNILARKPELTKNQGILYLINLRRAIKNQTKGE